jgi:hypothetical protein
MLVTAVMVTHRAALTLTQGAVVALRITWAQMLVPALAVRVVTEQRLGAILTAAVAVALQHRPPIRLAQEERAAVVLAVNLQQPLLLGQQTQAAVVVVLVALVMSLVQRVALASLLCDT